MIGYVRGFEELMCTLPLENGISSQNAVAKKPLGGNPMPFPVERKTSAFATLFNSPDWTLKRYSREDALTAWLFAAATCSAQIGMSSSLGWFMRKSVAVA